MEKSDQTKRTGLVRIAVTGPESTGKSTLSADLADYFNTVWVKEYAREYIDKLDRPYVESDLKAIAEGQIRAEEKAAAQANGLLICDTDLTVIKIWSEFKYRRCDAWIVEQMKRRSYDLYFLTDIDLPWEEDPQREHPHARKELFDRYEKELKQQGVSFVILSGGRQERLEKAVALIKSKFLS